jgi:hypothetical protein
MRQLEKRREQIVQQMAQLGPMRRGSVYEQTLSRPRTDGTVAQRGPYALCTWKRGGKSCGKRLRGDEEVALYQRQIETLRRFEQLAAELVAVSEQMADLEAEQARECKKNSRRSSKRKPSASGRR